MFNMRNFTIASANMGRRNHALHVLLEMNTQDDIICIQEPWWGCIGTKRADHDRWGVDVRGGAAHPKWRGEYPFTDPGKRAKVMTYVRKHDRENPCRPHRLKVVVRLDLAAHPCLLITNICIDKEQWRLVNFYNDVEDPSAMQALKELQIGDEIPTLLVGDFNLHSRTWSPGNWMEFSLGAIALEEWMASMTLELLTIPGKPTRRGQEAQNQRDSTLDMTWRNFTAQVRGTFQGAFVDWEGSHGSDHALIHTFMCTPYHVKTLKGDCTNTFNTDIDEDQWVEWHRIMRETSPIVYGPIHSPEEIDTIINLIYVAFNKACSEVMKQRDMSSARSAPWWSDEIGILSRAVQQAPDDETRRDADCALKQAV